MSRTGVNHSCMVELHANVACILNHPATKQVTLYTYDPFGYLVSISYVKENLQNEKITSNMTLTYDEFGNPINPNYQYTYDQTGTWTSKTSKTNPADSEKITYVYKQNKK